MELLLQHLWKWLRLVARILHRLWLEITGTVFLALAALGTLSAWREWRALEQGGARWELVAALVFVIMMVAFGLYSFWKARRLR